ncbi:MAG TPA: hypothetical protein VK717_00840 [Opitutaceae bacterium]|jgi:hypothetical protein|nr:hypothetical protein [Opitutaceae bacterium]
MKHWIKILLLGAALAGAMMFLDACVGGYVGVNSDYYGPAYGGVVVYGHPYYGGGFWGGPRGRRWR